MITFPNTAQLMTVMMGELPQGVYASDLANNGNPNLNSWSSSEIRAWVQGMSDAYVSLTEIYNNKFILTADISGIERWETILFMAPQDPTLPLSTRRANLLTQLRYQGGINFTVINAVVAGILTPLGISYQIVTRNQSIPGGVWVLGQSHLDVDTYAAGRDPIVGTNPATGLTCSLDYAAAGISLLELQGAQATAYTYQVRILGGVAVSDTVIAMLDAALTIFEPARSTHQIFNPFSGQVPDVIDAGLFTENQDAGVIDCGFFTVASQYAIIDGGTF